MGEAHGRGKGMIRIGFDIGGSKLAALALDPAGNELARAREDVPRDYAGTLGALQGMVEALVRRHGPAASVGIAMPGMIGADGVPIRAVNLPWLEGRPLRAELAQRPRSAGRGRQRRQLLRALGGDRRRRRGRGRGVRRDAWHRRRRRHRGRRPAAGRRQRDRRRMGPQPLAARRPRCRRAGRLRLRPARLRRDLAERRRPGPRLRQDHRPGARRPRDRAPRRRGR